MAHRVSKALTKSFLLASLVLLGWVFKSYGQTQPPDALAKVDYLDIGQGDSELITLPGNYEILTDGGPDDHVLDQLAMNLPAGDREIELMIDSHPDADHLAGLVAVAQEYHIDQVYMPDVEKDTKLYREWIQLLHDKQIPYKRLTQPETLTLSQGVKLSILHPSSETSIPKMEANNWSIIMRLDAGQTSFLFTGDAESPIEEKLVARYPTELTAQVLKVGHHGSKTSSSSDFLAAVQPKLAIISVGAGNRYGHPHQEVLHRYQNLGIPVLRTDQEGTIHLVSDGQTIWRAQEWISGLGILGKKYERVYTSAQR